MDVHELLSAYIRFQYDTSIGWRRLNWRGPVPREKRSFLMPAGMVAPASTEVEAEIIGRGFVLSSSLLASVTIGGSCPEAVIDLRFSDANLQPAWLSPGCSFAAFSADPDAHAWRS